MVRDLKGDNSQDTNAAASFKEQEDILSINKLQGFLLRVSQFYNVEFLANSIVINEAGRHVVDAANPTFVTRILAGPLSRVAQPIKMAIENQRQVIENPKTMRMDPWVGVGLPKCEPWKYIEDWCASLAGAPSRRGSSKSNLGQHLQVVFYFFIFFVCCLIRRTQQYSSYP